MSSNLLGSIRLRLPIPAAKTLGVGFLILILFIISVVLCFVFQDGIDATIGINPAHMSIVMLMVVLLIPWVIITFWLIKKYTKVGYLELYQHHLQILSPEKEVLKHYDASSISFVKIQAPSFHITFKDGYRFNVLNVAMGDGYVKELVNFYPTFLEFLNINNIKVAQGNIM
ncbi:hypothetical protein [Mucilaginibacter lacusdianchii]|uniref:hypothetical protein n=1 Tax=Mucilaginibacter lacusdianchii TaxID=2684211 RepID=UPI00131CE65E|nr:hypothetical protein [Mucilaginibacter sp. JXJ CY 39]